MLREWRRGRVTFGSVGSHDPQPSSVVYVKNISANDVTPGDVLGLGEPIIAPSDSVAEFQASLGFQGSIPSSSTPHYGKYGVVQEAARKTDGFCRCVIAGLTFVKLNITHADDDYCEIANGVTTYLTTGALGSSRILWKSSGTGSSDKWGLIRVGDPSGEILVYNATGSAIAAASSGTATVYEGTAGSETSTGQTLTVYNRTSVSWANGKFGSAAIINRGQAYVSPLQT